MTLARPPATRVAVPGAFTTPGGPVGGIVTIMVVVGGGGGGGSVVGGGGGVVGGVAVVVGGGVVGGVAVVVGGGVVSGAVVVGGGVVVVVIGGVVVTCAFATPDTATLENSTLTIGVLMVSVPARRRKSRRSERAAPGTSGLSESCLSVIAGIPRS